MKFRDISYCSRWKNCADGDTCERAVKPEVWEAARKWMNPPLLSIQAFEECFKAKKKENI